MSLLEPLITSFYYSMEKTADSYPLDVVPILSQMSIMSAQSSVVLVSLVAFSGKISKQEIYGRVRKYRQ